MFQQPMFFAYTSPAFHDNKSLDVDFLPLPMKIFSILTKYNKDVVIVVIGDVRRVFPRMAKTLELFVLRSAFCRRTTTCTMHTK